MKFVILAIIVIGGAYWIMGGNDDNKMEEAMTEQEMSDGESMEMDSEMEVMEEGGAVKEFTVDSFPFGYSETEIRVKKGDTVTINLTNSGGLHDWVVDEFDAATEQIPVDGTTSVTFVADTVGTFEYYCSVGDHRAKGMIGNLIVE